MKPDQAAENLQVIRTLMERSAVYRRALAPIMLYAGVVGIVAAAAGVCLGVETGPGFIGHWLTVAVVGVIGAFLLVRRQALKNAESFWSPPTRRVAQALTPSLATGLLIGVWALVLISGPSHGESPTGTAGDAGELIWLPGGWAIFYGIALHAAGFFALRGLRLFGWGFIAIGNAILLGLLLASRNGFQEVDWRYSHCLMGFQFGLLHLAYGIYLHFTEKRGTES